MTHPIGEIVENILWLDAVTFELVLELRSPVLTNVLNSLTGLGSVAAGLVFVGLFYLAGWREEFLVTLIALSITGAVVALLMAIIQRPYPPEPVCITDGAGTPTTSFPSGHAAAFAAYAMVARGSDKLPFKTVSALAVLVAFSRIYLGVHYFSDTVFGIALGIVSVLIAERIRSHIGSGTLAQKLPL